MSNPNIGYATLSIIPVLQGIQGSVNSQLPGVSQAGGVAGTQYGAGFARGAAPGIGSVGKLLLGVGAIQFFRGAIEQSNEFAQAQGRTNNVIATTAGAAGISAKEVADLADHLSAVDGISRNVAQATINAALGYDKLSAAGPDKILQRTASAGIDLAAAIPSMGNAASAADQLGRALQNPILGMTRLRRQGIILSASQQELVRNFVAAGQTSQAQGLILDAVERKVGGAAAAMATPLDHARASLKNFQSEVGQDVKPLGQGLATGLAAAATGFQKLPQPVQQAALAYGVLSIANTKLLPKLDATAGRLADSIQSHTKAAAVAANEAAATDASAEAAVGLASAQETVAAASSAAQDALAGEAASIDALVAAKAADEAATLALADAEAALVAKASQAAQVRILGPTAIPIIGEDAHAQIAAEANQEFAAAIEERNAAAAKAAATGQQLASVDQAAAQSTGELAAATAVLNDELVGLQAAEGRAALTGRELAAAQGTLTAETGLAGGAMAGLISLATNPLVIAFAAVAGSTYLFNRNVKSLRSEMDQFKGTPAELASELTTLASTGKASGALLDAYGVKLTKLKKSFDDFEKPGAFAKQPGWISFLDDFFSGNNVASQQAEKDSAAYKQARQNVKDLDTGLAASVRTTKSAGEAEANLQIIMAGTHRTRKQILADLPQLKAALDELAAAEKAEATNPITVRSEQIQKDVALRNAISDLTSAQKAYVENQKAMIGQSNEEIAVKARAIATAKADAAAEEQAARTLAAAVHSEQQAELGVADALRQREQAEQGVIDAAYSRQQAIRAVHDAEFTLEQDQKNQTKLAQDLTAARKAATEALYQDRDAVKQGDLSIESAKLALADALAAQKAGVPLTSDFEAPDPAAQAKLDLAVKQAKLALEEAIHQQKLNQEELNTATQKGVDGSPQVIAAQEAIAAGARQVAADQRSVTDAQHGVEQADRALADAHYAVAQADRGLSDANYALGQAVQSVSDDQRALAAASQKSKDDQIAAALQVFAMEATAKQQAADLATAYEEAFGKASDAAYLYGLKLDAINTLLLTITQNAPLALQALTWGGNTPSDGIPVIPRQGSPGHPGNLRAAQGGFGQAPSLFGNVKAKQTTPLVVFPGDQPVPTLAPAVPAGTGNQTSITFTGPVTITTRGASPDEMKRDLASQIVSNLRG